MRASAASARRFDLAAERPSGGGDSAHLLGVAIAVQHDVAPRRVSATRPLGEGAGKRPHREVVAHDEPVIADLAANDLLEDAPRQGRRVSRIDGGEDDMRRHGERHVGQHAEGREILGRERLARRLDAGKRQMAVGRAAAVAGYVLDDRQHSAGDEALGGGPAAERDRHRIETIGTIADHGIRAGDRDVEHGKAIDRDAERVGDHGRSAARPA